MPSSEYTNEPAVHPFAFLEGLLGWLASTTAHLLIGVVLGVIAAHAMRHRHLRWTWAASALASVVLARSLLAGWTTTLGAAALCATVRGRRWHREDLMLGGDLAEIAMDRRGPIDAVRAACRALLRWRDTSMTGGLLDGDRVIIGREQRGGLVPIPIGGHGGGRHTLVVGATGSGKTVTETWIVSRAVQNGRGAIVVDPKCDPRMRDAVARAAELAGRQFIEWTPRGPSVYNPFSHGAHSAIADKALAGERFTEPHYLRQAQRYLGHEVRALRGAGVQVSLSTLVDHLDPARLDRLARRLPEQCAQVTHDYLDALTPRQRSDLSGVRDRLAIMAESDVAPWLDPSTPGTDTFDLLTAVEERAVVYFSLESDAWPLLAQMLGVAIVQDLLTTVSALQSEPISTVVVIDEFSAIAADQVARLFGRARSAGMSLVLGTQELSDLRLPGREHLLEHVLGNVSTLIAHRQVVPDSAELLVRLGGARGVWKTSQSSGGRWTRTRSSAPRLQLEEVRALPPGWAAVIEPGSQSTVRIAQIFASPRCDAKTCPPQ